MKRCGNCKEPFTPIRSTLEKYCLKPECVRVWVTTESEKQNKKRKKEMKAELMTLSDWLKIAQKAFNAYIRERDKDKGCISCGKPINGVRHASHYLSAGGHSNVRFNEDNVWVSCYKCNVMLSGNQVEYRKRLIEQIGIERVEWLEQNGSVVRRFTIDELQEITRVYKEKLKQLKHG